MATLGIEGDTRRVSTGAANARSFTVCVAGRAATRASITVVHSSQILYYRKPRAFPRYSPTADDVIGPHPGDAAHGVFRLATMPVECALRPTVVRAATRKRLGKGVPGPGDRRASELRGDGLSAGKKEAEAMVVHIAGHTVWSPVARAQRGGQLVSGGERLGDGIAEPVNKPQCGW